MAQANDSSSKDSITWVDGDTGDRGTSSTNPFMDINYSFLGSDDSPYESPRIDPLKAICSCLSEIESALTGSDVISPIAVAVLGKAMYLKKPKISTLEQEELDGKVAEFYEVILRLYKMQHEPFCIPFDLNALFALFDLVGSEDATMYCRSGQSAEVVINQYLTILPSGRESIMGRIQDILVSCVKVVKTMSDICDSVRLKGDIILSNSLEETLCKTFKGTTLKMLLNIEKAVRDLRTQFQWVVQGIVEVMSTLKYFSEGILKSFEKRVLVKIKNYYGVLEDFDCYNNFVADFLTRFALVAAYLYKTQPFDCVGHSNSYDQYVAALKFALDEAFGSFQSSYKCYIEESEKADKSTTGDRKILTEWKYSVEGKHLRISKMLLNHMEKAALHEKLYHMTAEQNYTSTYFGSETYQVTILKRLEELSCQRKKLAEMQEKLERLDTILLNEMVTARQNNMKEPLRNNSAIGEPEKSVDIADGTEKDLENEILKGDRLIYGDSDQTEPSKEDFGQCMLEAASVDVYLQLEDSIGKDDIESEDFQEDKSTEKTKVAFEMVLQELAPSLKSRRSATMEKESAAIKSTYGVEVKFQDEEDDDDDDDDEVETKTDRATKVDTDVSDGNSSAEGLSIMFGEKLNFLAELQRSMPSLQGSSLDDQVFEGYGDDITLYEEQFEEPSNESGQNEN